MGGRPTLNFSGEPDEREPLPLAPVSRTWAVDMLNVGTERRNPAKLLVYLLVQKNFVENYLFKIRWLDSLFDALLRHHIAFHNRPKSSKNPRKT